MADTIAKLNITKAWTSTGTGDTLTCEDISPLIQTGVRISAVGIDLNTATVTVTLFGGAVVVPTKPSGLGEYMSVGVDDKANIVKVVISNVAAGTRNVTFSQ